MILGFLFGFLLTVYLLYGLGFALAFAAGQVNEATWYLVAIWTLCWPFFKAYYEQWKKDN